MKPTMELHSISSNYRKYVDELIIWQEDYWQRMLTDFKQLQLYDFLWLEPIKDAACQAECILQQILYPGMHTSERLNGRGTHQLPDMLDEVLNKLRNITHSSKKLIRLYQPCVEGTIYFHFHLMYITIMSLGGLVDFI
jgi:hypothetical protein